MLCPRCHSQWAPFPDEDFDYVPVGAVDDQGRPNGIYPKSEQAVQRRDSLFRSEEEEPCGCDEFPLGEFFL